MNLDAAVARMNEWLELLYDIHRAHMDPANTESQRSRVKTELLPLFLTDADWSGDAPFTRFQSTLKPSVATKNKADQLAQLVRRRLFKVEGWSAPDVGGVARCVVGSAVGPMEKFPDLAIDLAEVGGELRIVAMHDVCPNCSGTGVDGGSTCNYTDITGGACLDGLIAGGGLAFDPGSLEERRILDEDVPAVWKTLLER